MTTSNDDLKTKVPSFAVLNQFCNENDIWALYGDFSPAEESKEKFLNKFPDQEAL